MPAWPCALPQYVFVPGYEERFRDTVLRSPMDAGPAKTRRRQTAAPKTFKGTVPMTASQVAIFETFFETEIGDGALSFDWVHPRTQAAATLRLVTPPPPRVVPEAGGGTWTVSFDFEILP